MSIYRGDASGGGGMLALVRPQSVPAKKPLGATKDKISHNHHQHHRRQHVKQPSAANTQRLSLSLDSPSGHGGSTTPDMLQVLQLRNSVHNSRTSAPTLDINDDYKDEAGEEDASRQCPSSVLLWTSAESAPLVALVSNLSSSLLLSTTHGRSSRSGEPEEMKTSAPLRRIPTHYLLPETRRRAAITLSRWWRLRGLRAQARLLRVIKLIQRVGRGYAVKLRLRLRAVPQREQRLSFARSVRFCGSITACLNSYFGKSIDRLPEDGQGLLWNNYDDVLNRSRSAVSRSIVNASRSFVKPHASMGMARRSVRGVRLVNFDLGDAPPSVSCASFDSAEHARFGSIYEENDVDGNENDADNVQKPPVGMSRHSSARLPPVRRLSLFSYTEELVEDPEPQNEAFCCILNSRASFDPLSIKVARLSSSLSVADLGPWNPYAARRSTIARVCWSPSIL
ncbi:hypothetical protein DQ04_11301010 [Trypanosoma grayi]|uniref:hypothetical protein n=1 Tax=Trypanosoma grayi TaxID=71804 RepID=UPI0004F48A60|nr:hypothetical protein DQ04_11301010 [Trypanosoma grayi]KEG07001.1 hypothetical protein DQ04_11301010 [Trypanosoma grayi]